jgi:FtsP/CotA-like multicopper oxidase with cupredoxin domain
MERPTLDRRSFLRGALAGGAALGLGLRPTWAAPDEPTGKPAAGKIGDF